MKNNKLLMSIVIFSIIFIMLTTFLYGAIAFIILKANPFLWSQDARFFFVALEVCVIIITAGITDEIGY